MCKTFIFFITLLFCLSSCTSKFSKIQKSSDYEYKYRKADEYFAAKKYVYAQQLYEEVIPFLKGTSKYETLYYKLAYSYYNEDDYINAENLFKTFTETFPSSSRDEECEYMRAYVFYKQSPKVDLDQTNTTKAVGLLQAFISTHPNSSRIKEANELIDICREKLELKEYKGAELYFTLGYYKAATVAFNSLLEDYPDSKHGDEYKLTIITADYKYAEMSYEIKQKERFEKVISEYEDFKDRYPESKLLNSAKEYRDLAQNFLNNIQK
jgi:outer membrane protein assembly factor BamD